MILFIAIYVCMVQLYNVGSFIVSHFVFDWGLLNFIHTKQGCH